MLRSSKCLIPAPVQMAGSFDASIAATCWCVLGRIVLRSGVSKGSLGWGFGMGRQYAAFGRGSASVGIAHNGSFSPVCSATMYAAYQSGQFSSL